MIPLPSSLRVRRLVDPALVKDPALRSFIVGALVGPPLVE